MANEKMQAHKWRERSRLAYTAARLLSESGDWYGTANRAYYAAYQVCVSVCVEHGDSEKFPEQWNNPTHDQLPDLIRNNGDLSTHARRAIQRLLLALRSSREDADYRVGRTVNKETAIECVNDARRVFEYLSVKTEEK